MSYTLGDITLPNPKAFTRRQVETGASHLTLDGQSKKDILNRKEQFILNFEFLSQSQISQILGEFDLQTTRNFAVDETNLTITSTPVHISIQNREYSQGAEYRENIQLILTEVS